MSKTAKVLRQKHANWSLGQKGPPILIAAAEEIERLSAALKAIRKLESRPIGDTGFSTGPLALLNQAKRLAKDALSRVVAPGEPS